MTANREPHEDAAPPPPGDHPAADRAGAASASRRRMLRAGLGAAPVILTLANRPAFALVQNASIHESIETCKSLNRAIGADPDQCVEGVSISELRAMYSPSVGVVPPGQGQGRGGPGFLDDKAPDGPPGGGIQSSAERAFLAPTAGPNFQATFGAPWRNAAWEAWEDHICFGDVLVMSPQDDDQNLGKLLIAALESAKRGMFRFGTQDVLDMGYQALMGGLYPLPTHSTARWTQSDVIRYLTNVIRV